MAFPVQSIRYRFMILIALVAVPIAVFHIYETAQERQHGTLIVTDDLLHSTRSVVVKLTDLIKAAQELLTGLAVVEEIAGGNVEACSNLLHAVGERYAKYTNFSMVNRDKYIVCSSGPLPEPVHVANSPNIDEAFATGEFAVSPLKLGGLTGKPVLVFSEPLIGHDKQIVGTINNGFNLTWMGEYFATVAKQEGEHIVMFDDHGTVFASFPDDAYPVGTVVSDANLIDQAREVGNGTGIFTLENGGNMTAAFALVPNIPNGVHIVSFTSLDVLQEETLSSLSIRLAILGFYIAGALLLGWIGAKVLLLNPINRLVGTSEAMAKGNLKVRSDIANDAGELGRLGLAFDQMAEAVDARTEAMERAEKKIYQLAYTDHFTGMPNEAFFLERLNENIDLNCRGFVASMELSGMGDIIGTFGLEASELIIYETAKRLGDQMPLPSVVARTGDRSFKVMYISTDKISASKLPAIAERFYLTASDSFDLMGSRVFVNISMGISIIDPEESTAKSILTDVEIAHHEARNSITSSIVFFEDSIKDRLVRSTQIVAWLRSAIENKAFKLYFQPQVNLKTNTVVGCEALLRWPHNSQEWISPAEFIPIAERAGLIEDITTWTVDEACRTAASWGVDYGLNIRVSVNISAEELASPEFLHYVTKFIAKAKLPAEFLEIEITETALMRDVAMATRNLEKVRAMGATIAIDDFGTGQASLAYLKNFPIDRLKIDQSFVKDAPSNKTDREIIVSIVKLAHSLGVEVIAEGAEEEEHIKLLESLGCDEVQGFYIARPIPAAEFVEFVKAY